MVKPVFFVHWLSQLGNTGRINQYTKNKKYTNKKNTLIRKIDNNKNM